MKKSISLEHAIGKPLTGVYHSGDSVVLTFGDSFVLLEIENDYDDCRHLAEIRVCEKNLLSCSTELLSAEVLSQEEFDAIWTKQREEAAQQKADYEHRQYEALKLKFEGPRPLVDFRAKSSVNE